MEINIKDNDTGAVVVELSGRLDANTSPSLQRALDEMGENPLETNLTLDLSAVDYVSSAGLRVLLILQKKILAARGSLTIKNVRGSVRDVFDMTGFSTIFKIV